MKIVFKQYLASLRERGELDAILPDLLSELGYTVISRPMIGTRQYGVDVAAIGKDASGRRKLFLFSIKQGDLTRTDWDGTPQGLRSSINEILDVYIPTRIAKEHEKLEIVICLCFGGDIQEVVRDAIVGFTKRFSTKKISFSEWNGDHIAGLLVDGVLREHFLSGGLRNSFQKAVAMVDEPTISYQHFSVLLQQLCASKEGSAKDRATIIRQIYICLWVLFVWARDAGNVEGAYRASEMAICCSWGLIKGDVAKNSKISIEIGATFNEMVSLYYSIFDEFFEKKIFPFVDKKHAISVAVESSSSVDINIKLFEILGRIALRGIWYLWSKSGNDVLPRSRIIWTEPEAYALARHIINLIDNNPILLCPIADEQAVDVGLAILFLAMIPEFQTTARDFVTGIMNRFTFSYRTNGKYPTIHSSYRDLILHPRERTDEYREAETAGSSLVPLLSIWASSLGGQRESAKFAAFADEHLKHCNLQFWIPADDTEELIYSGDKSHGASLGNLIITEDCKALLKILDSECRGKKPFSKLTAISEGHWPILAVACRHYRIPLPPNLWIELLHQCREENLGETFLSKS